jgi:large subunit ribosomal protein L32e
MTKEEVIKEFTEIKGLGKAKAELLYKSGFDSLEKLKKASVKDLSKIDGISESVAKNIKEQLKEKVEHKVEKKKPGTKEIKKAPAKKIEEKKTKAKKKPASKAKPEIKEEKKTKVAKKEEKEEEEEVGEKEEYKVKRKPKLSKDKQERLKLRKKIKKRRPEFLREEWFRYKRIAKNWRKPDGITSKMRTNLKYRPSKVRVGFRGPSDVRGLHSSGFEEVLVFNINDLEAIDPKIQAARIGSSVGTKKRMDIEKKAEELDIRILNV